jgi:heme-degrading monooxygenase HmoA
MSGRQERIKDVKHKKVKLKTGKREESTKVLLEFFKELEGKATGMRGFMVIEGIQDLQESLVLTFWETKEDMDAFYQPDNTALFDLVEKLKPSFEQLPVRKDYRVAKFKV